MCSNRMPTNISSRPWNRWPITSRFFTGKVSEQLLDALLAKEHGKLGAALSPRERVIVQLIAEGHTNREMTEILNLSVKTIETHRAAAMRKLNVTSTAAIVRYAIRNKLVEP